MNREIGKRIKHLRLNRNMTQEALAQYLHVTRQNISSWETGRSAVSVEYLTALSTLFDVSIEELIYGFPPGRPYRKFQRKYFICIGICGMFLLLAFLSRFVGLPYIRNIQSTSFLTIYGVVYTIILRVLSSVFAGIALCAIISLWGDLRLRPPVRFAALAGSIVLVSAAALLTVLVIILYHDPQSPLWAYSFVQVLYRLWLSSKAMYVLGFLAAVFGFLGMNQ